VDGADGDLDRGFGIGMRFSSGTEERKVGISTPHGPAGATPSAEES
jgi:hypothetical protein